MDDQSLNSSPGPDNNLTPQPGNSNGSDARARGQALVKLQSEIGARYSACRFQNWQYHSGAKWHAEQAAAIGDASQYVKEFAQRKQLGSGVCFFGPTGAGKDHLAAALIQNVVVVHGSSASWVNGMEIFGAMRDLMGDEGKEAELLQAYIKPDIFAISDPLPPLGSLTEFQISTLYRIVDGRYRALRPTVITLNVQNVEEAAKRMSPQLASRVTHNALMIPCGWPDFRMGVTK